MGTEDFEEGISTDLPAGVEKAINLLIETNADLSDRQVAQLLYSYGIEYPEAIEIAIFLPIAFCRLLLPNFHWNDEYYEFRSANNERTLRTFSDTSQYLTIYEGVRRFFSTKPNSEVVLKIAGRSSEFQAINELLIKGNKLEDIKLTPINIVW